MNPELIFNLWVIYDSGVGFIYALSGRAYYADGTDANKLLLLRNLAATDHVMAKRYEVPSRFQVCYLNGTIKSKVATLNSIRDPSAQLFEELFDNLESELPPLLDFSGTETIATPQKIPNDPVCVVTILYEDEFGNIRPIITEEDSAWLAEQDKVLHKGNIDPLKQC